MPWKCKKCGDIQHVKQSMGFFIDVVFYAQYQPLQWEQREEYLTLRSSPLGNGGTSPPMEPKEGTVPLCHDCGEPVEWEEPPPKPVPPPRAKWVCPKCGTPPSVVNMEKHLVQAEYDPYDKELDDHLESDVFVEFLGNGAEPPKCSGCNTPVVWTEPE